jgi:Ca2+:H+ antiporter
MLIVYIASRIYLIDPPGDDNALELDHTAPEAARHHEEKLKKEQPKLSPGFCAFLTLVLVVLITVIAEFVRSSLSNQTTY